MTYAITCQNPACQIVKTVRDRYTARKQHFCSKRCATLVKGVRIPIARRQAGAERSKVVRRAAAMRKLAELTPVQIYRKAYSAGWHAGLRYARKWAA